MPRDARRIPRHAEQRVLDGIGAHSLCRGRKPFAAETELQSHLRCHRAIRPRPTRSQRRSVGQQAGEKADVMALFSSPESPVTQFFVRRPRALSMDRFPIGWTQSVKESVSVVPRRRHRHRRPRIRQIRSSHNAAATISRPATIAATEGYPRSWQPGCTTGLTNYRGKPVY